MVELTRYMFICELDVDDIVSGFGWFVCYAAAAVFVVMAFDVGFTRAFDG